MCGIVGYTGIGHTRWATHGAPTEPNAHPHTSNDGKFAVVHNGITEKTMSNIVEVKARGAEVLAVAHRENGRILPLADDMIFIPKVHPLFSPVLEIAPLQLFAYYVAKENGCDINKPKNLAKSVTVE